MGLYPKLIITMSAIFAVVLLAILGSMYMAESRAIEESGMMQAEALNRMAFEALYASMRQGGGSQGNNAVIERLRQDGAFDSLRVVKGVPVFEQFGATPDELPQSELEQRALAGEVAQEIVYADGNRIIHYATPLIVEEECTQCHQAAIGEINGVISTSISLAALDSALEQRRNYLLRVVAGSLLLLVVALFFALQGMVVRPLQRIRQGTAIIAAGDLEHRLNTRTGDELESLAGAINRMVEQLNETHADIVAEQGRVLASIHASHDAIWISDADRRIVTVNPALEQLTGRRKEDLLGQNCQYLMGLHTLDGASACDTNCPFLHPEGHNGTVEGCMPSASGSDAWVKISYGRVSDSNGDLAQVVHIVHDLTERREVEQLKDEFVSMVSHELRTPLHHIKGFATTLLQTDVEWDAAAQHDFLESINSEADRLSLYVDKILHLSRLEAGVLPLDRQWHSTADLIDGALVKPGVSAAKERIRLALANDLSPLYVDGPEIETVLLNLIDNSVKYAEPDTPITIHAEFKNGLVAFCVSDHGPGIRPQDQAQIFERFARVDSPARSAAGSGLGLATCRRIVESHGGTIWVESEEDKGSRFCFTLPAHARQPIELLT